jgi:hypothetical protein
MPRAQQHLSAPVDNMVLPAMMAWPTAWATVALQAQQEQLKLLVAWQEAATAMQRDWWDRWIARFGGGVPIDV